MSNEVNTKLLERADHVKSFYEGTDVELAIDHAIKENNLDHLEFLVLQGEAEMSRQAFYNYDVIRKEYDDVY